MKPKPKLRKVNTKKRKKDRKEAQEALQQKTAAFLDHPKECCMCDAMFERTKEAVTTWHVVVNEGRVRLTCPDCWSTIKKAVESRDED